MSTISLSAAPVHSDPIAIPDNVELIPPELLHPFDDDAEADPADWPDLTDEDTWEIDDSDAGWYAALNRTGDAGDAPCEPRLPFADWIEVEAAKIRLKGSDASAWLAGQLDAIAATARYLKAVAPIEFDSRLEAMEDIRDGRLEARGYDRALVDAFGH